MTSGRALLSTRPGGEHDPLVARLRALGYGVHAVPTVATEPLPFDRPDFGRYDWVVVTSAAAVEALLGDAGGAAVARWAAVGPRTAAALAARGVEVAALPGQSRGAEIADAIAGVEPLSGLRVLLARADAAAADLPAALEAGGARVEQLSVYHTVVGPEASRPALALALADPALAAAIFASGSAVRGLVRLADRDPTGLPAITIGPATSTVARQAGFLVVAEAGRADVAGLVAAVQRWLEI